MLSGRVDAVNGESAVDHRCVDATVMDGLRARVSPLRSQSFRSRGVHSPGGPRANHPWGSTVCRCRTPQTVGRPSLFSLWFCACWQECACKA